VFPAVFLLYFSIFSPFPLIGRILILQAWYGLSDEALEKQIARDLMFRRFIGLSLSEVVPDHATIWRFRQRHFLVFSCLLEGCYFTGLVIAWYQ
jgi:transposase